MTLSGYEAGQAIAKAEANTLCADVVYASQTNPVVGVPALLLELIDLSDPLSVGDTTVYQVTVTNQGSGPATNITLVGGFEDMSYVASRGHTPIKNVDKGLAFDSFSLGAKESASWQIQLKADIDDEKRRYVTTCRRNRVNHDLLSIVYLVVPRASARGTQGD